MGHTYNDMISTGRNNDVTISIGQSCNVTISTEKKRCHDNALYKKLDATIRFCLALLVASYFCPMLIVALYSYFVPIVPAPVSGSPGGKMCLIN